MRIALVHDWLTNMGGAERVLISLKEVFSDAPIYTSIYNPENLDDSLKNAKIITSFINKFKDAQKKHQKYFPFMPMAFESFNLNEFDIVISSSSSCAKGIITKPDTVHICYCHTPMRYAWEFYYEYYEKENLSLVKKKLLKYFMSYMRIWDRVSADRVDYFIANSKNVAKRIWKHYRRDSVVIYPPVRTDYFKISNIDEEYFLIVSRLVAYKRIDLAIETFNKLKLPLVIIGDGPEKEKLKRIANENIKFLGRQPDEIVKEYYSKCRALIFPGEEDFGITPVEAQASGRPVIAFGRGGALETVIDGVTGLFFHEASANALIETIKKFEKMEFDKQTIRNHAKQFDEKIFKKNIKNYVEYCYMDFKKREYKIY